MPLVTDWISSIGTIVGSLAAIGALVVAFLSYRKANRALAADAQTRGAVGSTFQAVEALGHAGSFDAMLDAALKRREDAETHEHVWENGYLISREKEGGQERRDEYLAALEKARRSISGFNLPSDINFPADNNYPKSDG